MFQKLISGLLYFSQGLQQEFILMIAKFINKRNILHSANKSLAFHQHNFRFTTIQTHAEQYRNFLLQLNSVTLKNELQRMKNITSTQSQKLRKTQIIDQLCQLQENQIQQRLKQLQGKSIFELQSKKAINVPFRSQDSLQKIQQTNKSQPLQKKQSQDLSTLMNHIDNQKVLEKSLEMAMDPKLLLFLRYEKSLEARIMGQQYQDYLHKIKQNKDKMIRKENPDQGKRSDLSLHQSSQGQQQSNSSPISHEQLQKLKRKSFVNVLFKTNDQIFIEEQKRKYLYEQQKPYIIDKIVKSNQRPAYQEFLKNITQIKAERKQNLAMRGFYMNYQKRKGKLIFEEKKDKVLKTLMGFNHFKQMCTNPYLIRFLSAFAFEKDIPLEYTMIKMAEESQRSPESFKKNLIAISKEYFVKILRISSNYLQKVFKSTEIVGKKDLPEKRASEEKENGKNKQKDEDYDDDEDEFDIKIQEKSKKKVKKQQQSQNFPNSRQFIDLQLMRFAFSIFEAGIQKVVNEITTNKQLYFSSGEQYNRLKQNQQKQIKIVHETLLLCFDIYKTMQSLFASIQINDFNDLNKLIRILTQYNQIRKYLQKNISLLHNFMQKHDRQYEEKLELGLINIVTEKQLNKKNFILKFQARKLNFDIIDNITSMLKHDNIEITLENKREKIFNVMEQFFRVYVENDMMEFLEDQLIYTIVRFLEKQIYLDQKVKGLFESRVNFDEVGLDQLKNYGKEGNKSTILISDSSELASSAQLQWFQPSIYSPPLTQTQASYDAFNPFHGQKQHKSYYFMGQFQQLLPKPLLYYLITIIKYKHERKEIAIQQINNFNLIQDWYSEPNTIRLQFLKEQIVQRYKRLDQKEKYLKIKRDRPQY